MAGAEVQKWADKAMFKAEEIDATKGPEVTLLSCNPDPLGTIAAAALMYEGKSVGSLAEVTDTQRRYYLEQVQRSVLEAPLEFVNFHFIISGVSRGFTHQMVRQRTATYTQESTRFAVKETVPVALPPSLVDTVPWKAWLNACWSGLYPVENVTGDAQIDERRLEQVQQYAVQQATPQQLWRREWDDCVEEIDSTYNALVSAGMPAEDARGLLPTNLLTRINYNTSLRGLKDHAGVRLCTQAQYEWRQVWTAMLAAIREFGRQSNGVPTEYALLNKGVYGGSEVKSSQWQFDALADIFKPICYYKGRCQFMSDVDRACVIRDRVEAFADLGIPSVKWGERFEELDNYEYPTGTVVEPISREEWMAEGAARVSQ